MLCLDLNHVHVKTGMALNPGHTWKERENVVRKIQD